MRMRRRVLAAAFDETGSLLALVEPVSPERAAWRVVRGFRFEPAAS